MTDRYQLRPWRGDDALWYIGARDREILRWTTEPERLTAEEFADGLAELDAVNRLGYAIVDADDRLVGNVAAVRNETIAEISYWVAASDRGRGAATFALDAMTSRVMADWPVTRIELLINPDNAASVGVASRCGYALVGARETCLSCAGPDGTVIVYAREVVPAVS